MKKILSLIVVFATMTQILPAFASGSTYADIENHWAKDSIEEWSGYGVINGYNNEFRPNDYITRGELAVILDRIMGYEQKAKNNFIDLDEAFYTEAILKANRADIIKGDGYMVRPRYNVTREEASVMIARALHFDTSRTENTDFKDDQAISSWAKSSVYILHQKGIVKGTDENNFLPKSNIKRAEVVTMLNNAISLFANVNKKYTEDIDGNVIVNKSGAVLENMDIKGDLIIAEGIEDGSVYVDNVGIDGNVTIKGGGENSIYLRDVTIEGVMICHRDSNKVRIVLQDKTKIPAIYIEDNVVIDAKDLYRDLTVDRIVINGGSKVDLIGDFDTVENNVTDIELSVDGDISHIIMEEGGEINGEIIRPNTVLDKVPNGSSDVHKPRPDKKYFEVDTTYIENGSISLDKTKAQESEVVRITAIPDINYTLDTITVINTDSGRNVNVTNGKFIMPSSDVLVSAVFKKVIPKDYEIELKDIESVNLYMMDGENVVPVNNIKISTFDRTKYIAQVTMKNMPKFYADISSGAVVDNKFMITLDYDNAVSYYEGEKLNYIQVPFGDVSGDRVVNYSLEDIIEIINNDPNADVTLTQDVDMNDINALTSKIIDVDFTGTFNGNGHKISNLDRPMFKSITDGTINNVVFDNAKITSGFLLAGTIDNATIKNVHIKNSNISSNGGSGAFASVSAGTTVVEESSISNTNITGGKRTGGFIGNSSGHLTIKNSYITGSVTTNSDAAGGMLGEYSGNVSIENSYCDIDFNVGANFAHGGMVGYSSGSPVKIINSISLADGVNGKRIIGFGALSATNSYEIEQSKLVSNAKTGITTISENDVNDEFILNQLKWDNNIWKIKNNTSNDMPMLNNSDFETVSSVAKPETPDLYIPEIDRLKALPDYDQGQEIAYHNMSALMPFYEAEMYVENGNQIPERHILNTTKIKTILAYHSDGSLISGLNTTNYDEITKIKIVFEDEQIEDYDVSFNELIGDIATYNANSLPIGYNYNKFVLNTNISLVDEIIASALAMDYETEIAIMTPETESRLYVDYYNETVIPNLDEVIIKIMQSEENYNIYLDNDILKAKIKQELTQNNQLEKILYTYNYYDKWYGFDIGEVKLSDIMFFNVGNMISNDFNIQKLVANTLNTSESNRNTGNTIAYYNSLIKPQTNKDIKTFLEYYMNVLAGYTSGDDWFTENFKGLINEKPVRGKEDTINYRAWDLMNTRSHLLLPILSAPQEDMYIISVPSQFMIGSLNRYQTYLDDGYKPMEELIENYARQLGNFYTTSSSFINNSTSILNSKVYVNYDTRFHFPSIGHQNQGTTEDPVMKWVYEAIGSWAGANGSGAYANGTDVYWVEYAALAGDMYWVFSHETAHNQDGYYFYESKWRRLGTWAEDHADGNITQGNGDQGFVFNITDNYSVESNIATNFTLDRISSPEKIHSYYKEMFETYYVLDYLTGQAFLKLTPKEQSRLATQATDTSGNVVYKELSEAEFSDMNLKTMEDLWNNKIVFTGQGSNGENTYGGDSHFTINWYQPHNDTGRPNSNNFKRLGFEMLGVGGYTDGYVAYRSEAYKNDLEALQTATGNPNNTWKDYKMDRYENVANNLDRIPYFDSNEVIDLYSKALVKDAVAGNRNNTNDVRRSLYGMVKRVTNDFETDTIYSFDSDKIVEISTAEQLLSEVAKNNIGTYKLVSDLDFTSIDIADRDAYFTDTFLGIIDGNGFKMHGLTKPLFKKTMYAYIKNIAIEQPIYDVECTATIIIDGTNSILENISVDNANINVPFIQKNSGCSEF